MSTFLFAALFAWYFSNGSVYIAGIGATSLSPELYPPLLNNPPMRIKEMILAITTQEFAKDLIVGSEPVVIKRSIVDDWPARKLWNFDYLQSHPALNPLYNVRINKRPHVTYFEKGAPLDHSLYSHFWRKADQDLITLKPTEFFKNVNDSKKDSYWYYNDEIPKGLIPDLKPYRNLLPNSNPSPDLTGIWIGARHVVATPHYDTDYNFYAQLIGTKRWVVFHPKDLENACLFPRLSPHFRQSQVVIDPNTVIDSCPTFRDIQFFDAVLEPGDVLYLPPYWGHQVQALEFSVSVNFWSSSTELKNVSKVTELPFRQWIKKAIELESVPAHFPAHSIAEKLIQSFSKTSADSLQSIVSDLISLRYSFMDESTFKGGEVCDDYFDSWYQLPSQVANILENAISKAHPSFQSLLEPLQDLHLKNVIEDLVFEAVDQDPHRVPHMLYCWSIG